jgi:hypothetical protein
VQATIEQAISGQDLSGQGFGLYSILTQILEVPASALSVPIAHASKTLIAQQPYLVLEAHKLCAESLKSWRKKMKMEIEADKAEAVAGGDAAAITEA